MDMTKAFSKVQHSKLFWKLVDKGIPPIYIRLLLTMYEKQQAIVCWNNKLSKPFPLSNGKKKTGCLVDGEYVGIVAYADDLLLLSPTLDGL